MRNGTDGRGWLVRVLLGSEEKFVFPLMEVMAREEEKRFWRF